MTSDFAVEPKPVQNIYEWYRDKRLLVNRSYQRKLVWSVDQKRKLIDSIMNRYPIPLFLLSAKAENDGLGNKQSREVYEIIDGMQRLHAIVSFIEQKFCLGDGRFFDVNEFSRAKNEGKLGNFALNSGPDFITPSEVSSILSYSLSLSVVRGASTDKVKEIFGRINYLGRSLSDQEQRQSRAESDFGRLVRLIATDIRGDVSDDTLFLEQMPSISIDKGSSDYGVKAGETFWVRHGILRGTELRDSVDEQVVADILVGMIIGRPIERTREALDAVYEGQNSQLISKYSLESPEEWRSRFKWMVDIIDKIIHQHQRRVNKPAIYCA